MALSSTMALIDRLGAEKARALPPMQPAFINHWKAPKNSKGGFRSFEDMKAEAAAKTAAEYGPPQGPCASFRDTNLSFTPVCFCGWHKGAHTLFVVPTTIPSSSRP